MAMTRQEMMIGGMLCTSTVPNGGMAQGMATGERERQRERNKREMGTDMLLTGVQRARGPGQPSFLISLSFRWLGWGCRAQLTLLAFLSIYFFLSLFFF